jgi:hypothetical protein
VLEYEKYIAHATCGDSLYVISKYGENPSKDEQTLNHARLHARAVLEHEKYIAHATCGDS